MTTFALIHGTFAKRAAWTQVKSPLRNIIEQICAEKGKTAEFLPIQWSAKNRISDRINGAELLASTLNKLNPSVSRKRIILIGHSHGGSVIAYYLRNSPDKHSLVNRAIFLSTPFLALRRRDGISQRIVAYFYTTCLAVQIAAILLLQLLHSVFHVHDTVVYIGFLINLITVVIFIYEYRSSAFTQTINNYLITTIDKFIDNNDTCNLPHGDYLIVRFLVMKLVLDCQLRNLPLMPSAERANIYIKSSCELSV